MIFKDRTDAGIRLAQQLTAYKECDDAVVYALPRGGVVLGVQIARALDAPLDLIIVRKVGHPRAPEYAIAAVAEDGHIVTNPHEVGTIDEVWFAAAVRAEQQEAQRRRQLYMSGRPPLPATGKCAILVDDGLATGLTMLAAIHEVRRSHPAQVVVAVPIAPPEAVEELEKYADKVVALYVMPNFRAIASVYVDFDQVSDGQVIALMKSVSSSQMHR